jgi:hypothetical protein
VPLLDLKFFIVLAAALGRTSNPRHSCASVQKFAEGLAGKSGEFRNHRTRLWNLMRIGLGKAKTARGFAKNNVRDSQPVHGSNQAMTNDDSRESESGAMNTLLVMTLTLAAAVNAWCLYIYL